MHAIEELIIAAQRREWERQREIQREEDRKAIERLRDHETRLLSWLARDLGAEFCIVARVEHPANANAYITLPINGVELRLQHDVSGSRNDREWGVWAPPYNVVQWVPMRESHDGDILLATIGVLAGVSAGPVGQSGVAEGTPHRL